jgi:hypothetical protein
MSPKSSLSQQPRKTLRAGRTIRPLPAKARGRMPDRLQPPV